MLKLSQQQIYLTFIKQNIFMDLIEITSQHLNQEQYQINYHARLFDEQSLVLICSNSELNAYFFQNLNQIEMAYYINVDFQYQKIQFRFSPIYNFFFRFYHKFQIGFATRVLLKYNSTSIYVNSKLNPINGHFILTFQLQFMFHKQQIFYQNLQQIWSSYIKCKQEVLTVFQLLPFMKLQNKKNEDFEFADDLNRIKRYIMTSSLYSWKILQENTLSGKEAKKTSYEITKNNYDKMQKYYRISQKSNVLTSIQMDQIQQVFPYTYISRAEDELLKSKYLDRSVTINKNAYQMNQITISKTTLDFLKVNREAKISCYELGIIKVKLQIIDSSRLNQLKYQKIVISTLPKNEFIGIPKYYFLKNTQIQSELYLITNLFFIKQWNKYIESNRESISFFTLLSLTYQKITILRYLKENNIVFHKLTPINLVIKKGLCINIINLSNSYNPYIQYTNQNHYPAQNQLPYVLNYFDQFYTTYGDERSDSYNLGVFLYQNIFQKTPHNIKDSDIRNNQSKYILKLQKNPVICFQKVDQLGLNIFKLMVYLALIASYNEIKCLQILQNKLIQNLKKIKNNLSKQVNLKSQNLQSQKYPLRYRPYLDWISIITKNILDYTHLFY